MRGIEKEKFRPFLWRNHCLMMIREVPLRLRLDRTGKDRYRKRGGQGYFLLDNFGEIR
jgi:hypothetical protein